MSQAYKNLLSEFANEIGLQPLEQFLETEEVVIDDITVSLYFEGDEDLGDVVFFSLLGKPSGERQPAVTRVLLEANYLWAGTGGATLGMSPEDGTVIMAARLPLDTLNGAALASILDAFVDSASYWRRYVSGELNPGEPVPNALEMNFAIRG